MATKNEVKTDTFMDFLKANEDKLRILLSGDKDIKPLQYQIKGKRSTKTIFIAEKLQFLMNEYCIENDLKIGDMVETAIIRYFTQVGLQDKLAPMLNTPPVEIATE